MKTKIYLLVISVLYYGITFSQTTEKLIVNFATGSYVLEAAEQEKLLNLLSKHKPAIIQSLSLKGHTDNVGTDDYNKTLSSNRTKAVSGFLQQHGIPSSAISTGFFGEQAPIETNADEKGKAHNRRVEVEFTFNEQKAEAAPEKKASAIQPPIPGLERQFQFYTVNTALPCTLTTTSGAQIRIPANAFVDEKGRPVKGEVQLGFRDYYKPLEVLLSGIPMTYDSAGIAYNFETDGMFEIKAMQGDKELSLGEDKNVAVDVPATPGSTGFNLYTMQDNGSWNNIGQPGAITQYTAPLSDAWSIYLKSKALQIFPDTTPFANRFPDPQYVYLRKKGEKQVLTDKRLWGNEFRLSTARRRSGDKKGIIKFNLNGHISHDVHAEMRRLTREAWVYDGPLNKKTFASSLMTVNFKDKRYFNDMRLVKNETGDGFIMELKGSTAVVRIPVHPYGSWDLKTKTDPEKFRERAPLRLAQKKTNDAVFASYSRALVREERNFNKDLNKRKQKALKAWEKNKSMEQVRRAMSEEEKKMSAEEWMAYGNNVQQSRVYANRNADIVFRTVSINGLGVYNCDRIGELKRPVPIIADCKDQEGKHLGGEKIYVLDESLNGVSTFTNNRLTVDPNTTRAIILIDAKGQVAYANNAMLEGTEYKRNQKTLIVLHKLKEQPKSEEEFGKLLGLAGQ